MVKMGVPFRIAALAVILMTVFFAIDLAIPLGVAGGVPYVAVVLLGIWLPNWRQVITLAVLTSLLTILGYFHSPAGGVAWMVLANRGLALFAIWVCALLVIQRQNAEAKTLESARRYRSLMESAPVAVVIFVLGRIALANRAAADLFGVESAESLVGKTITDIAHPEEVETALMRLDKIVAEKISAPSTERRIARSDGSVRDVGVRSNYLRWMGEDAVQIILSDITERKQLQEQLAQSQKMEAVGRLTAGVAHDFNNVLMAIIANLEMLEDDAEGDDEHLEMIATAAEAARRGAEVTARLSAFSRQQTLAPQALDLPELCASVVALLKPSLGENIEIETRDRGLLSRAYVDPGHLQNALVNLAVNAQDAMPEGGKLRFELADVDLDSEQLSDAPEVAPGA